MLKKFEWIETHIYPIIGLLLMFWGIKLMYEIEFHPLFAIGFGLFLASYLFRE